LGDQSGTAADCHVAADHAIRTDFDVIGDSRARIDARGVSDYGSHARAILLTDYFMKN
jgi:hypothetical protein